MTYSLNPFARDSDIPYAAIGSVFIVTLGKMLDAGRIANPQASPLPYVRAANIQDTGLDLNDVNTMPFTAIEAAALDLRRNDVLVVEGGAVGTCVVLQEDLPGWSFQKTVNRLRPTSDWSSRFIAYVLRAYRDAGIIDIVCNKSTIPHLTAEKLRALRVPALPPGHQEAIANYLDRETARIDTLIEEQQRLIEMLHERRHSLVEVAFCARMPNARFQNACIDVVDCLHTTPEASDDGEYEAVRTASVRHGKFRPGNGIPVTADTWNARNAGGAPTIGDVLFTREAPAGEACMVPSNRICLGQRMVLLRIDPAACVGRFLLWQIYSDRVQNHFVLSANGSTVANVRLPVLRTTPIWLPDLDEQRRIADNLDEQTAKIDQLITESERFIELARERRSALITAAVTGQIDVCKVA